jgi:APA family basic amino acid/polyamine antiporter
MDEELKLKRELGLLEVTLSGVGIIFGAGIYAIIGEAATLAGNAVWLSFAMAALVAFFTGLSYAELASMFPKASAEYEYTFQAFGRRTAFIIGWLIILSSVVGSATVALGFANYFKALFHTPVIPSAIAIIALLSLILLVGVKQSARLAIIFTIIESLGLILIIALGLPYLGKVNYMEMPHGMHGVFQAAALIFFAFIGFEEMVKLSEETRNPEKTIPQGLILAVSATIFVYILVALSAVSVLGWQDLGESEAPFADIAFAAFGNNAFFVISVIATFATANTLLLLLLSASRITYGMAESSSLPQFLAMIHQSTRAPWTAILATMILSMLFLFTGDIGFVANVTNFTLFVTFMVINAALIVLRYKRPEILRPFRVPINMVDMPVLPMMGLAFCAFMLSQLSIDVLIAGTILTIIGSILSMMNMNPEKY